MLRRAETHEQSKSATLPHLDLGISMGCYRQLCRILDIAEIRELTAESNSYQQAYMALTGGQALPEGFVLRILEANWISDDVISLGFSEDGNTQEMTIGIDHEYKFLLPQTLYKNGIAQECMFVEDNEVVVVPAVFNNLTRGLNHWLTLITNAQKEEEATSPTLQQANRVLDAHH